MADHDAMIAQLEGMKGKGKKAPAKKTGGKKGSAKSVATGKGKVGVAGAPAAVQEAKEDVEAGGRGNGPEECPTCGSMNPAGTIEHRLANLKARAEIAQALAEEARKAAEAIEASNVAVRANRDKVLGEWSKGIQEQGEKNREAYRNAPAKKAKAEESESEEEGEKSESDEDAPAPKAKAPPKVKAAPKAKAPPKVKAAPPKAESPKAAPKAEDAKQEITKHYPQIPMSQGSPWDIYIKFLKDIQSDSSIATHKKSMFGYDENIGHKWSSNVSYPIVAYSDSPHQHFESAFYITYDGKDSKDAFFQVKIICGWDSPYIRHEGHPMERAAGPDPLTPIWLLISCRNDSLKNKSSVEALSYCLGIIEREKGKKTVDFGNSLKNMRWGEQYREACLAQGNFEAHYFARTRCFTDVEDDYRKAGAVDWKVNDWDDKPWEGWRAAYRNIEGDRRANLLKWLNHKGISTKGVRKDYDLDKIQSKYVNEDDPKIYPDPTSNEDDRVFAEISETQSIEEKMRRIYEKLASEKLALR